MRPQLAPNHAQSDLDNHPLVARATTGYPHRVSRPTLEGTYGTGCPAHRLLR